MDGNVSVDLFLAPGGFRSADKNWRWKCRLGVGSISAPREAGDPRILGPGQAVVYESAIRVLDGMEEIDEFRAKVAPVMEGELIASWRSGRGDGSVRVVG